VESVDVLVVGAGPAGAATALHLQRLDPFLAGRVVVLDRAHFPRPKLCGGGVTLYAEDELRGLDLDLPGNVRSFDVARVHLHFQELRMTWFERGGRVFRVVRRDDLDHWLVRQARARGVAVREGVTVVGVRRDAHGFVVRTDTQQEIGCRVLVGAGGARGIVRQVVADGQDTSRVSRMLEVLTPCASESESPEFREHLAVFDFSPVVHGVQGYYWDFPSYVDGRPTMNRGIFDSRVRSDLPLADLKQTLAHSLARRGHDLHSLALHGHPSRWYHRDGLVSGERILLVGDEAGFDPLFGEGIAFALAQGRLAAGAIRDAFRTGDFSFADYPARLRADKVCGGLAVRSALARRVYALRNPRHLRLLWRVGRPLLWLILTGRVVTARR
jgi:menaquinone-9 beta-reductase